MYNNKYMDNILLCIEIVGTIAFSISGATEAIKKNMDIVGVLTMSIITSVGGGVLRDIILGELPPNVFYNPYNIFIATIVSIISFSIAFFISKDKTLKYKTIFNHILLVSDSVGLGAFTILGIRLTNEQYRQNNIVLLLFAGVLTGVGGGITRDIFAGNVPYIFRKHIYATASLTGALTYVLIQKSGYTVTATSAGIIVVFILRILAAKYEWNLPGIHLVNN